MRDQCAALRDSRNQQRRLADSDRFTAGLAVVRGIFDSRLDQGTRCALTHSTPGKIGRQYEVEVIHTVFVCLAFSGCCFKNVHIHARYLEGCLCVIDRLTKKVVSPYRSNHVIARTVVTPRLFVFLGELDGDFEFRQDIPLHVEGNFRSIRRSGAVPHQGPKMICAQVHLVSQRELRGGDTKMIRYCAFFEDLVAARVFHLEGKVAISIRPVAGTIKGERAHMDRLARLVDRFLGGEHNQCRILKLDGLRVFGRTYRCVGDQANIVFALEPGGKVKLGRDSAVPVEAPGKEGASPLLWNEQFGSDRAGEYGVLVAGVRNQHSYGGIAAGEVFGLADHANDRPAQDARDRFNTRDRWYFFVAVFEAITHPLPDQVFEGNALCGGDALLPGAIALDDFDCPFGAPEDAILRVDDLCDELARTRARPMVRDADQENAMRKRGCGGRSTCFRKRSVSARKRDKDGYEEERKEKF